MTRTTMPSSSLGSPLTFTDSVRTNTAACPFAPSPTAVPTTPGVAINALVCASWTAMARSKPGGPSGAWPPAAKAKIADKPAKTDRKSHLRIVTLLISKTHLVRSLEFQQSGNYAPIWRRTASNRSAVCSPFGHWIRTRGHYPLDHFLVHQLLGLYSFSRSTEHERWSRRCSLAGSLTVRWLPQQALWRDCEISLYRFTRHIRCKVLTGHRGDVIVKRRLLTKSINKGQA